MRAGIEKNQAACEDDRKDYFEAMKIALDALDILADRYRALAEDKEKNSEGEAKERYRLMI